MPNSFTTYNLPLFDEDVLSRDPQRLLYYLRTLVQKIEAEFANISNIVNLNVSSDSDTVLTFTPVVVGSTIAGTGTYEKQVGIYSVLGKVCWFTIQLEWDNANHTGTGNVTITGMPKTSASTTDANLVFIAEDTESGLEGSGIARMAPNTSVISGIYTEPTWEGYSAAAMNADHTLTITGVYRTT